MSADLSRLALLDSIKADHGFNMDSRSVRNLLQVMSELTVQQRRDFLQFVTGSPKLPIGGSSRQPSSRSVSLTVDRVQESYTHVYGSV